MVDWQKRRRKVKTATYSLEIRSVFRECVDVVYEDGAGKLLLDGALLGEKGKQINLAVPPSLLPEDSSRVLANLEEGLRSLGYEYLIFRMGALQPIPEQDQLAAIAGLRQMGLEPEVSMDGSTVKLKKLPSWEPPLWFKARDQAVRMSRLLRSASGKRSSIELLAKSDSAEGGFV